MYCSEKNGDFIIKEEIKAEIEIQMQRSKVGIPSGEEGWDELGDWD